MNGKKKNKPVSNSLKHSKSPVKGQNAEEKELNLFGDKTTSHYIGNITQQT